MLKKQKAIEQVFSIKERFDSLINLIILKIMMEDKPSIIFLFHIAYY